MPTERSVGRPQEVDKSDLLDAAQELFAEFGFEGTSTREIAKKAKCNSALISYHFGGKEGLYRAVLERNLNQLGEKMRAFFFNPVSDEHFSHLKQNYPELKDPTVKKFYASLHGIARMILTNQTMQKITCREMMSGSKTMVAVLSKSENTLYAIVRSQLEELQKSGKLDPKVDLRFAVLTMIGPIIYSCIAANLLRDVYGFRTLDDSYTQPLCAQIVATFFGRWGK